MSQEEFIQYGVKMSMPASKLHLGEFFLNQLTTYSGNVAVVTEVNGVEISLTHGELLKRSKIASCILKDHGLKSEDTVMITCGNTIDFIPVMLGSAFLGIACSPVNPEAGTSDFKHLLSVIKPSLVLCDTTSYDSVVEAVSQSDVTYKVMTLHDLETQYTRPTPENFQMAVISDLVNHVALVLTTSGTTGLSKGVEISHATLLYILRCSSSLPASVVALNMSGPFWGTGISTQLTFSSIGAKQVLLSKFTENAFLETIQKHKVNFTSLAPDKVTALAKWSDTELYDTSSLISLSCSGGRLSRAMKKLAEKRLKKDIYIWYGMTESFLVFEKPQYFAGKPGTVGRVVPNGSAKIVDVETGKPLGPNCEGELCYRTPVMLKKYRGNPEATKALFDEDGFLYSGDIAYYDSDGFFFIIDRIKGLIKYKMIQVIPQDIEEVLLQHEAVQEVAVVGIPNDDDGEHATAFVIKKSGSTVTSQELISLVKEKLTKEKWLYGGVVFVDSFPRTASDKVKKRDLRTMHVANMAAAAGIN